MITDSMAKMGIAIIKAKTADLFHREARMRRIEEQEAVYSGTEKITNVLTAEQEKARENGEEFKPDLARAADQAKTSLEFGVGNRLEGAYACYKADMEMECLRHILLALGSICHAIGWKQADAYINDQNRNLLEMKKQEMQSSGEG